MAREQERFHRAGILHKGYRRKQVDAYLRRVEAALRGDGAEAPDVTARAIRRAGFDLVRRGYDVGAVDAHFDELERRALERDGAAEAGGWGEESDVGALLAELAGEPGHRFPRAPALSRGYRPADVDRFLDSLQPAAGGAGVQVDVPTVRQVLFRAQRGGYSELAVDDALDGLVELLMRRERTLSDAPQAHP